MYNSFITETKSNVDLTIAMNSLVQEFTKEMIIRGNGCEYQGGDMFKMVIDNNEYELHIYESYYKDKRMWEIVVMNEYGIIGRDLIAPLMEYGKEKMTLMCNAIEVKCRDYAERTQEDVQDENTIYTVMVIYDWDSDVPGCETNSFADKNLGLKYLKKRIREIAYGVFDEKDFDWKGGHQKGENVEVYRSEYDGCTYITDDKDYVRLYFGKDKIHHTIDFVDIT